MESCAGVRFLDEESLINIISFYNVRFISFVVSSAYSKRSILEFWGIILQLNDIYYKAMIFNYNTQHAAAVSCCMRALSALSDTLEQIFAALHKIQRVDVRQVGLG